MSNDEVRTPIQVLTDEVTALRADVTAATTAQKRTIANLSDRLAPEGNTTTTELARLSGKQVNKIVKGSRFKIKLGVNAELEEDCVHNIVLLLRSSMGYDPMKTFLANDTIKSLNEHGSDLKPDDETILMDGFFPLAAKNGKRAFAGGSNPHAPPVSLTRAARGAKRRLWRGLQGAFASGG